MPLKKLSIRIANMRPGRVALGYVLFGILWVAVENRLLVSPADVSVSQWLPRLLPDLSLVLLTGVLLFWLLNSRPLAAKNSQISIGHISPEMTNRGYFLLLLVALLAVSPLITLGVKYFYTPKIEQSAYKNLRLVSKIKVVQFERWRDSRVGDAEVLAADPNFAELVSALFKNDTPQNREPVAQRLRALLKAYEYEGLVLLDTDGKQRLLEGEEVASDTVKQQLIATSSRSATVVHSDLYTVAGRVQLDVIAPITRMTAGERKIVAYVIVHTGIDRQILPRVLSWPSASSSAAIVMVRQGAGRESLVHYHATIPRKTALTERPLAQNSPYLAERRTQGMDFRNQQVYLTVENIQGSAWRMVGQIERDEVMAPLDTLLGWIASLTLIAMALLIGAVLLLLRQQQRTHQLELLTESSERDRLLKRFYDMPFIGMAVIDSGSKRWTQVNDRLCQMLGYEAHELLQLTWVDITHPDDLARDL